MSTQDNASVQKLHDYDIDVCRIGAGFATIRVNAANEFEAGQLALDQAGDHEYSEKNSEYELVHHVPNPADCKHAIRLVLEVDGDNELPSVVRGMVIDLTGLQIKALKELSALTRNHGLSEVRKPFAPDQWIARDAGGHEYGLRDTTMLIGRSEWFQVEGQDPLGRGRVRTPEMDIAEIEALVANGVKEIIFAQTGVTPLSFCEAAGKDVPSLDVGGSVVVRSWDGDLVRDEFDRLVADGYQLGQVLAQRRSTEVPK